MQYDVRCVTKQLHYIIPLSTVQPEAMHTMLMYSGVYFISLQSCFVPLDQSKHAQYLPSPTPSSSTQTYNSQLKDLFLEPIKRLDHPKIIIRQPNVT